MCVVSMISDFYRYTYPIPSESIPNTIPYKPDEYYGWTKIRWEEYQELLRKAAEYDRLNNQPNCVDPKKEEFTKKVEKVLREKGIIK